MTGLGFSTNPNCYFGDHDWQDGECLACGQSCEEPASDNVPIGPAPESGGGLADA